MRRRNFLKAAAGFSLTLPILESLGGEQDLAESGKTKRLFLMTDGYGFHTPNFYPKNTGNDYAGNDVLKSLEPLRKDVTLLGNLRHLSGHGNMKFVAAGSPQSPFFGDSVDQVAAKHLSKTVPLDSLLLSTRTTGAGGSFRNKVPVAMMYDVEEVFDLLFTKGDLKARNKQLRQQQSLLDLCLEEAKGLSKQVSASDQQRLEEYFNSIRETEQVVQKSAKFVNEPEINPGFTKEDVAGNPGDYTEGDPYFAYLRTQMKFVELAFKYDLTRVAYLWEHGRMHGSTHHGNRPGPIGQLTRYATDVVNTIAGTLITLKETKTANGGNLLDETLFVWTAALGSAAKHTGVDAPAIIAGGGFPHHGQYKHFDNLEPTTKLHLTVLQHLGVETGRFADSDSTLNI